MTTTILQGDVFAKLLAVADRSVQMCLTSPPFFALRSYLPAGHPDKGKEIGSEPTPDAFVATMVAVFREVRRVLRDDGVLVLNLGDSYAGSGKGPTGHNGIGDQEVRQGFRQGNPSRWKEGTAPSNRDGLGGVAGIPPKNLLMIPFRAALALQADGWYLRSVIPWIKRNPMPESVQDRPATAVEYLFLFSKRGRYFWDHEAIKMPGADPKRQRSERIGGKNGHTVRHGEQGLMGASSTRSFRNSDPFFATWQGLLCDEDGDPLALVVNTFPFKGSHFATFAPGLVEPFVRAGTRPGDVILDPFGGAGTVGLVASRLNRDAVLIELDPKSVEMARARLVDDAPMFASVEVAADAAPVQADLFGDVAG